MAAKKKPKVKTTGAQAKQPATGSPESRKAAGEWAEPLLSLLTGEKDFRQALPDVFNLLAKANEEKRRLEGERQAVYVGRAQALRSFAGKRLEALRAAPGHPPSEGPLEGFRIRGRILDEKDGQGLANVKIVAKDLDRKTDEVIGTAITDWEGRYSIAYRAEDFADPDRKPEIYLEVYDDEDKLLTRTSRSFIDKTAKDATLSATVSSRTLPQAQDLKARLSAGKALEIRRLELGTRALGQAVGAPAASGETGAAAEKVPKKVPEKGPAEVGAEGGYETKSGGTSAPGGPAVTGGSAKAVPASRSKAGPGASPKAKSRSVKPKPKTKSPRK